MRRGWTKNLPLIPASARSFLRPLRALASLAGSITALVQRESRSLAQGFAANLASSLGDLFAGAVLGSITGRLEALPGLLILIPPAIGMRGNIFAAMGSRLGTALHLGAFEPALRRGAVLGDNVSAATVNTLVLSVAMAPMARIACVAFGVTAISTVDFMVISVVGGVLASAVLLVITVFIAIVSARKGWDLDYVSPPLVTFIGDVVTLPSLVVASYLARIPYVTPLVATAVLFSACAVVAWELWHANARARRIVKESIPVLVLAAIVDIVAGVTLDKRVETFLVFPAFLVMLPAFLEDSGSLGSMLAARLSSRLHAGIISPSPYPLEALPEFALLFILSIPVYLILGVSSSIVSAVIGAESPGVLAMLGITLGAGLLATIFAAVVAYYGAIASYRIGLDPDNHGTPLVTSSMDVAASVALIVVLALAGYARL